MFTEDPSDPDNMFTRASLNRPFQLTIILEKECNSTGISRNASGRFIRSGRELSFAQGRPALTESQSGT